MATSPILALVRRAHQRTFSAFLWEHILGRLSRYARVSLRTASRAVSRLRHPVPLPARMPPARVLVVSEVNGLGDAILFRRLLEPLSAQTELTLSAKGYHHDVYREFLAASRFHRNDTAYGAILPPGCQVARDYDMLLLHGYSLRNALLCWRYGHRLPTVGILFPAHHGAAAVFEQNAHANVLELYRAAASQVGITLLERYPAPAPRPAPQRDVLIHLGSSSAVKNWCFANFVRLNALLLQRGLTCQFIGGAGDIAYLDGYCDWRALGVQCVTTYAELRDRVLGSRVVVCHNTAVLHLAAAYGVPTVSINRARDYRWWHPYRDCPEHVALTAGQELRRDVAYTRNVLVHYRAAGGNPMFDVIRPETVAEAVLAHLARYGSDS